jgi:DHA3 family macrolide efflux protein-like MFS transporter
MSVMQESKSLRPFWVLWSGQAISLLGSRVVQFGIIWYLTQQTGSATVLAMASLVGFLPQVVLGPFAGVWVDRWNRRRTMLVADSLIALATLGLAALFWLGWVQTWHIFVLLFVRALGGAFHWPAMQASTSLMVPKEKLARIQGMNQMLQGGLGIVAAPVGALLLSVLPMDRLLMIDVGTAVFAIVPLFFIHVPQPPARKNTHSTNKQTFWQDMREGLLYVWSWPGILMLMILAMMINFVLSPAASLMPILVTEHFGGGAVQLSWLESAMSVGLLAGGILLSVWGGFERRIITSLLAVIGLAVFFGILGILPADAYWLAVGSVFLAGLMMAMANGPLHAIFQSVIAPEMQGRFFTLIGSVSGAMTPLGLLIAGPVADALGVQVWYLAGGLATLALGIVGFFIPAVMQIEEQRAGLRKEMAVG